MQTPFIDQLAGSYIGDYHLTQLLGRGQVNVVYLAQSPIQIDPVIVTVFLIPEHFSPEERKRIFQRFRKEALTLLALRHSHILPVVDYKEHAGYPCFVTPCPSQSSLKKVLKQQEVSNVDSLQSILQQTAAALDFAHNKGVIHGSLKPDHLLLKEKQGVMVTGFGLQRILQLHGIRQHPLARLHSITGTSLVVPEYTAPEMLAGQPPESSSDIYTLGIILWELWSGTHPVVGKNPLESVGQTLSPALASIMKQVLDPNPARRFQSAGEMVHAFIQAVGVGGDEPSSTRNQTDTLTQDRPTGRWQIVPPIITGKVPTVVPPAKSTIHASPHLPALEIMKTSTPPAAKPERQSKPPSSISTARPKKELGPIIVKLIAGSVAAASGFLATQWVAALLHRPHLFEFFFH